jgi:hypothetical protein
MTQPGTFPAMSPSLYGLSLGPLLVGLLGMIASFAPFDSPRSALRWASCLAGVAVGVGVGGLVLFTPTFLWLVGPLLLYAFGVRALARIVARGDPTLRDEPYDASTDTLAAVDPPAADSPADSQAEGDDPSDPYGLSTTLAAASQLDDSEQAAAKSKGVNGLLVFFAVVGVAITWCWAPGAGGARPASLDADLKPVIAPPASARTVKHVTLNSREHVVEVEGNRINVRISLRRPTLVIKIRQQTVVLQPCLQLEVGTTDGFFAVPWLNTQRLGPGATAEKPAQVQFVEGRHVAWIHVAYGGRASYPSASVAGLLPSLGRCAGEADVSAILDVEVDLRTGRVTVDARTTLARAAAVQLGTLTRIDLRDTRRAQVSFGIGPEGVSHTLAKREDGAWVSPLSFLTTDGNVARFLKARSRGDGPFEGVDLGEFGHWLMLPGKYEPLLVVAPDWAAQASLRPSRSAGQGLLENALLGWWEGERLTVAYDLAGTRIGGKSTLSTTLPAGIYRNRIVVTPLGRRSPETVAASELVRLGAGLKASASAER